MKKRDGRCYNVRPDAAGIFQKQLLWFFKTWIHQAQNWETYDVQGRSEPGPGQNYGKNCLPPAMEVAQRHEQSSWQTWVPIWFQLRIFSYLGRDCTHKIYKTPRVLTLTSKIPRGSWPDESVLARTTSRVSFGILRR